jgi:hypothetical protein
VTRNLVRVVVPNRPLDLGPEVMVFSPFEAKDILKDSVPSSARRWDSTRKCWLVPLWSLPSLIVAFRLGGYGVIPTHADGRPWEPTVKKDPPPAAGPARAPFSWLPDAFHDASTAELRENLRRALIKVWHPDRGHPTDIAERINTAANNQNRRAR